MERVAPTSSPTRTARKEIAGPYRALLLSGLASLPRRPACCQLADFICSWADLLDNETASRESYWPTRRRHVPRIVGYTSMVEPWCTYSDPGGHGEWDHGVGRRPSARHGPDDVADHEHPLVVQLSVALLLF